MEVLPLFLMSTAVLVCMVTSTDGKVFCFRRLKKSGKCGGNIKKFDYATPQDCCSGKGLGFSTRKQKVGRNRFLCTPCSDPQLPMTSAGDPGRPAATPGDPRRPRKLGKANVTPAASPSSTATPSAPTTTTTTTVATSPASAGVRNDVVSSMTSTTVDPAQHEREKQFQRMVLSRSHLAEEVEEEQGEVKEEGEREREQWRKKTTEREWPTPYTEPPNRYGYVAFPRDDVEKIEWSEWSPCSASCGAGWRSRFKLCDGCDKNDYENVMSRPCMINFYCPVDGNWGPWFPWQPCSNSCSGGTRIRQRKCNYPPPAYGGLACQGDGLENDPCNDQPCPVNGQWSEWSDFTTCSATCGSGVKRRVRDCDNPVPAFGGRECPGAAIASSRCEVTKCPQDGAWSEWGEWSQCAASCEQGLRSRTRECSSPRPKHGGRECEGESLQTSVCYTLRPCPVDGGWSAWNNYGFCRASVCEWGFRIRTRLCSNPRPQHGGAPCEGNQYDRVECFNDVDCPRNGSWCAWSEWSACTATCADRSALQLRQRVCGCPELRFGGKDCEGDSLQVKDCPKLPSCTADTEKLGAGEERTLGRCGSGGTEGSGNGSDCDQDDDTSSDSVQS